MTMSFAEQVRAAVTSAEGVAESEHARAFHAVLDELVTGLQGLGVGARVQPGKDPRKLSLYLHPPHRPARVNLMLTLFLDGDGIVVMGEGSTSLKTPDELQRWLLHYVQSPAFVESLRVLREEGKTPVEARLRVDRQASHAIGDVVVAVSADEQAALDAKKKGDEVELQVERLAFPGNGQLTDGTRYALLESAGLSVAVTSVETEGEKLVIRGERAG